ALTPFVDKNTKVALPPLNDTPVALSVTFREWGSDQMFGIRPWCNIQGLRHSANMRTLIDPISQTPARRGHCAEEILLIKLFGLQIIRTCVFLYEFDEDTECNETNSTQSIDL
ncbi:hypothetical protein WA026_010256, partial [Henosepilachna vigintioctopunctata]